MIPHSTGISYTLVFLIALSCFVVFSIKNVPFWIMAITGSIMLGIIFLFSYFFYSSRRTTFELSTDGLKISGTMYG